MFLISRDGSWERIQHKSVESLTAEGKIMVKIRRSFLSDEECSDFLRLVAEKVHNSGVPCFGKRGLGDIDKLSVGTMYHHTFLFYAKNRFDALYVNRAIGEALFCDKKIYREITRDRKFGYSRAVTTRTKWKTNLESMYPTAGNKPDNGKSVKEVRKVMEYLVKNNPEIADAEIAALLAFNDYSPILICDLLLEGFVGVEDNLDIISPVLHERFSSLAQDDVPFFDLIPRIDFVDLIKDLSEFRFVVPPDMRQPSDSASPYRCYS